jgi:hypothetical protein
MTPEWEKMTLAAVHAELRRREAIIEAALAVSGNVDSQTRWAEVREPQDVLMIYAISYAARVEYAAIAKYARERERAEIAALQAGGAQ